MYINMFMYKYVYVCIYLYIFVCVWVELFSLMIIMETIVMMISLLLFLSSPSLDISIFSIIYLILYY